MVIFWSPKDKRHSLLIKNLARSQFSTRQILDIYALRWQIELLLKEWEILHQRASVRRHATRHRRGAHLSGDRSLNLQKILRTCRSY